MSVPQPIPVRPTARVLALDAEALAPHRSWVDAVAGDRVVEPA